MDDATLQLSKEIQDMSVHGLLLEFSKFQSLWNTAKDLREREPESALRLLSILSMKAQILPATWRETIKDVLNDTVNLTETIGGRDYVFALKLAELFKFENNYLAAGYQYKRAADALGRDGISVLTTTYSGTDDASERIRYLKEAATCFESGGDGQLASDCYVKMMHLQKSRARGMRKLSLTTGWVLWGWGERPLHVVFSAFGFIMAFALLYSITGLKPHETAFFERTVNSLYFSVITFATVGYGDITPSGNWSKLLAAIEGLTGIFFTGLFLVTFVKRSTR